MAIVKITLDMGSESYPQLENLQSEKEKINNVIDLLSAINSGMKSASVVVSVDPSVAISALAVSASGQVEDETFTLNGVTFTLKDDLSGAGSTGLWIENSGTVATFCGNVVQGVNAYASSSNKLSGVVTATEDDTSVTFTASEYGTAGNGLTLSGSVTNVTVFDYGSTGIYIADDGTETTLTAG
jgi:hypothetical protein